MYIILNNKIRKAQTRKAKYADKSLIFDCHTYTNLIPFKCVKDTILIWFQYRLLHRKLGTNKFPLMINYIDSNKCVFRYNLTETLQHLFYDCNKIREHWRNVEK